MRIFIVSDTSWRDIIIVSMSVRPIDSLRIMAHGTKILWLILIRSILASSWYLGTRHYTA